MYVPAESGSQWVRLVPEEARRRLGHASAITAETREQWSCECRLAPRPESTCGLVSAHS